MPRPACFALLVTLSLAAGCASTGSVPKPFPTPGSRPAPASAPPEPLPAQPSVPDTPDVADPEIPGSIAATALTYRGVHYRNGGTDPDAGFDCSGFVWYVFARHGIAVPRTVTDQYREGRRIEAVELRSGDLVFFNTTGASPSHVGIALGGDQFVHAPSSTGEVRVERLTTSYWSGRFVGIRRFD